MSLAKEGGKRTTLVSLFFFTFFCYIEKASKKRNTYKKLERTLKNYYSAEAFLNLNHHKKLYENKKKKKKSSSLLSMAYMHACIARTELKSCTIQISDELVKKMQQNLDEHDDDNDEQHHHPLDCNSISLDLDLDLFLSESLD